MLLLVPFLAACVTRKEVSTATSSQEQRDSSRVEASIARSATLDSHRVTEWSEELTELSLFELDTVTGTPRPRLLAAKRHTKRTAHSHTHATVQADTAIQKNAMIRTVRQSSQTQQKRYKQAPGFVGISPAWLLPLLLTAIIWRTRSRWTTSLKKVFHLLKQ